MKFSTSSFLPEEASSVKQQKATKKENEEWKWCLSQEQPLNMERLDEN